MKARIIVLSLFTTLLSCKKEEKNNVINENFCNEQLEITVNNNRVIVDQENDSAIAFFETIIGPNKMERKSFKLTKAERQKLFSDAFKLITLKEYTLHTKTCYAGQNFILKLSCHNKSLEFHESSVESWSKISNETKEIYAILKDKIEIAE